MENEQADAGRDGPTRLAGSYSQARTGTGKCSLPLFSWPRDGFATLPGWSIICYMWWPYIYVLTIRRHTSGIPEWTQTEYFIVFWKYHRDSKYTGESFLFSILKIAAENREKNSPRGEDFSSDGSSFLEHIGRFVFIFFFSVGLFTVIIVFNVPTFLFAVFSNYSLKTPGIYSTRLFSKNPG